jgi:hypothetical protein
VLPRKPSRMWAACCTQGGCINPNWSGATDAEKVGRSCEDAFAHLLAGWTDRNMTAYLAKRVSRIARLSEARKLRRE